MKINEKLKRLGEHLEAGLVARRDHCRMLLLAAVSGENVLLFGPPGTAKSLLARRLRDCFDGDMRYFECLLTKFSMPEEVFGPISLKGLEQDVFRRVCDRYMPGAGIAFVDETFKANSAILNSMLTILNEREFDTGNERIKVPLRCVVGASNEMPKEAELEALYDRFVVRMRVDRLADDAQLKAFLVGGADYKAPPAELRLTARDLEEVDRRARTLPVDEAVFGLLVDLRRWCLGVGIKMSDRRLGKLKRLLQVAAATSGRESATLSETWVLRHCAWDDFASYQMAKLSEWLDARIDKQQHDLAALRALVSAEGQSYSAKAHIQAKDKSGKPLYLDFDNKETTESGREGYAFTDKDDNNGRLYSKDEICRKLLKKFDAAKDHYGHDIIKVNQDYIHLTKYFGSHYEGKERLAPYTPKLLDGIYSIEQRERFKAGPVSLIRKLKAKRGEIEGQTQEIQRALGDSPWTPESFQEGHLAGLRSNLYEIDKHVKELEGIVDGYDKLLVTSDVEKLTDPKA